MRDVGDGDRDDMAAGIVRIGVGPGVDRVVVILGIDRIDGDERQLPPVLAAGERRLPRLLALAAFGAGLAALVGGGGVILGANLTPLIGVGLLGGSSLFVLIGARLATLRFP